MAYLMVLFLVGLVLGLVGVASNPAPYFAAFGLVVAAGLGCGVLLGCGGSFLSLVLFLIYLGGMLVVFAYSAALASDPYPVTWGDRSVLGYLVFYCAGVCLGFWWFGCGGGGFLWLLVDEFKELIVLRGDISGVALMYSSGGGMLVVSAWVLLLALFVVLELTRGLSRGGLRAV
uniref:NADH dehydrogenase subunit 6 n=1 Tax=Synodus foetens TaxID=399151 RepID=UPI0028D4120A|nr:NADH dehydrogenase subunit 6 [Synodus foetens]WMY89991.1 NADH dehydrogenase subunit 6 [Synodus foetens]